MGEPPTLPAVGTNRRLTVFGSVAAHGQGRVEVVGARADSAGFRRYREAVDARHAATGREVILVLDNGSCHTSQRSRQAWAERADWREVVPLARSSPELNPKKREWRWLKRDHRSHLAADLPSFVAELLAGLGRLGGARCDIVDAVPAWWRAGHRTPATGRRRPGGRLAGPRGARTHPSRTPARTCQHVLSTGLKSRATATRDIILKEEPTP